MISYLLILDIDEFVDRDNLHYIDLETRCHTELVQEKTGYAYLLLQDR